MIRTLALLVTVVSFWQFSCNSAGGGSVLVNSNPVNEKSINAPTPQPQFVRELNLIDSDLIYSQFLDRIFYGAFSPSRFTGFNIERFSNDYWLCYRKTSILPEDLDALPIAEGVTDQLVTELKRVNEKREVLEDNLGEKLVAKAISSDEDLGSLFRVAQRRYPKVRIALGFSRIALSQDGTKALLFVEYCSEKRSRVGFYVLVPLEPLSDGSPRFSISDDSIRAIAVSEAKE